MPTWLDRFRETEETPEDKKKREQEELELKNKLNKVDKIDDVEKSLKEFRTKAEGSLNEMSEFLKEQKAEKARREAEAKNKKASENKEAEDKDLEELALTDPVKAAELIADRKMGPLVAAQINTQSVLLRKQIFDDNPSQFEYYHGEFKNEVDKLIDNLDIRHKTNPEAIKHCYAIAYFNKQNEIKEGKLKSRFAATSSSSNNNNNTKDKETINLNDEQKRAAKALGVSEEEYGKLAREMNYV